jgi:hypothetical protein
MARSATNRRFCCKTAMAQPARHRDQRRKTPVLGGPKFGLTTKQAEPLIAVDESSGAGQDEEGQQGLGLGQAKLGLALQLRVLKNSESMGNQ